MTLLDAKNKTFDGDNFIFSGVVQGGEPTSRGAPDDGDPGSSTMRRMEVYSKNHDIFDIIYEVCVWVVQGPLISSM